MKTLKVLAIIAAGVAVMSCGTQKKAATQSVSKNGTVTETVQITGIDMVKTLSNNGKSLVERPYKWFAGTGTVDNKQAAIELAELEARAAISRVLSNAVLAEAERGNVITNSKAMQAVTSHWEQVSSSLQKACELFGDAVVVYDKATKLYTATVKVGMKGDVYMDALNNAGMAEAPADLTQEEAEEFIQLNKTIMEAAKR